MLSGISGYYVIYFLCTGLLFLLFRKHIQEKRSTLVAFLIAVGTGLMLPFLLLGVGETITGFVAAFVLLILIFFRLPSEKSSVQDEADSTQESDDKNQEDTSDDEAAVASDLAMQDIVIEEEMSARDTVQEGDAQEAIDRLLAEMSLQQSSLEQPPTVSEEEIPALSETATVHPQESVLSIDVDYLLEDEVSEPESAEHTVKFEDETKEPEEEIIYPEEEVMDEELRFEENVPNTAPLEHRERSESDEEQDEEYFYRLQQVMNEETK
ncbi:hypothetical protein [Aneurinibacillus sp. REN35]|uniref:hypothetical protein n=1 Tax=Aneurinibacillus sp. REN35 TaxID=3237286 RepID=UPI0035298AFA